VRIYVAGPYTIPDPESNTRKAIDAGLQILQMGHFPFIPHLTHYVDLRARELGKSVTWEEYIQWDVQWLEVCDALLLLGRSKGADIEVAKARSLGLKIFLSLDDIPAIRGATRADPHLCSTEARITRR
jgi:hypothetical protein